MKFLTSLLLLGAVLLPVAEPAPNARGGETGPLAERIVRERASLRYELSLGASDADSVLLVSNPSTRPGVVRIFADDRAVERFRKIHSGETVRWAADEIGWIYASRVTLRLSPGLQAALESSAGTVTLPSLEGVSSYAVFSNERRPESGGSAARVTPLQLGGGASSSLSAAYDSDSVNQAAMGRPLRSTDPLQQQTVGDIAPGDTVSGVLEESDARSSYGMGRFADNYRLTLSSAQTLRIAMRSTEVNAYVYIFDLEGFDLGFNNDQGDGFSGTDSRLDFTLTPGEYLIQATTANAGDGGAYTLSVELLGPAKPAEPLSLGQTVEGVLEPTDNRTIFSFNTYADLYELSVPTAQTVDISAESNVFDTLLALTGLTGGINTLLATDDDGGSGSNSAMAVELEPGRYLLEISAFAEGEVGPYTITVGGTAPAGPVLTAAGVVSSASFLGGSVVPGEILSFFGTDIGPAELTTLQLDAENKVTTELGGTRILFDGQPAAMIFAVDTQASAIAPFSLAGQTSTTIQIEVYGQVSTPVTVPVAAARPAIFSINQSGSGPAAALNQDYSVNSAANPAARGSVLQIFLTGGGVTIPPSEDGGLAPSAPPLAELAAEVTATIGGRPAQVLYKGGAPGLINGLVQVNALVAEGTPTGDAVEVIVTIGGVASPAGVTVAIQ